MKKLLMGNEAAAVAALAAGVNVVCGYPGTPSTEALETAAKYNDGSVYIEWSINEKAALEVGAGAAYAGARVMVTMKQVGLNACTDPVMSLAYIGVSGGMVLYVADDPGPISSQTEQDTRRFGLYSKLPVFDPSTPEELYSMIGDAFELSERIKKPVIVRPTTRVCHCCAAIDIPESFPHRPITGFTKSPSWVIFPRLSKIAHSKLEELSENLKDEFSSIKYNYVLGKKDSRNAVISSGSAFPVTAETAARINADARIIKVGCAVPSPEKFLLDALKGAERVLVCEELDPVIEDAVYALKAKYSLNFTINGRRDFFMPISGEYDAPVISANLTKFLGIPSEYLPAPIEMPVRPPVLCAGCPHRASFYAVKTAMKGKKAVFCGDIGCYTLGNAAPLDMVDTCLCMGAGVTIAQGIERAEPDTKSFAFIGDSTFFHSGITGLINAVYNKTDINIIILDNSTTAMTGHQPHPGTGITMMGEKNPPVSIEAIVRACSIEDIAVVDPLDFPAAVNAVKNAADHKGVSVIIFRSPCIAVVKSKSEPCVINEKCTGCKKCIREIGCPAMEIASDGKHVKIDPSLCTGCGLCKNLCAFGAIV